ncbi:MULTISPECIES: EAL domain-containing protein [unclassified Pseudofrankia]|uniref:EAL domain-containing protein n=1 Tax=unclassified Pseudofrankia TaxID=2994372 RepID=UPI0008D93660|nr:MULTISPECIES: EAL domain-containing protein [unclassified Pseudofrankia]MDT3442450.1 EAL domain-containing protein [Pseudofrankia sp. BMG5.37]OHV48983.1 diguanylate phosphodiesterase [Pseudofrankia sp. BMG5.36]
MMTTFGPRAKVIAPDRKVTDLLDVLRLHMDMDVAVLGMWDDDLLVVQVIAGDGKRFSLAPGTTIRHCRDLNLGVENGSFPPMSPDVSQDPRTRNATILACLKVSAYAMTALTDPAGESYGMLLCMARRPRPAQQERHSQFLRLTAAFLGDSLLDLRHMWEARSQVWSTISDLIDAGGPRIVYQPIVRLDTGGVTAVEALARFPNRCCGRPHNTEDWFLDAHLVGLSVELEMVAIRRAVAVLPQLTDDMKLAVNASPSTIAAGLVDFVHDLPGHDRLTIEITEHENSLARPDAMRAIRHLHELGIHIAIDDTGTGYSGLEQLVKLRPDIIKLDHILTRGINRDPARRALAAGLVQLAREIDGTVVAEGVETSAERDAIVSAGISYGQGYLLGKPAPTLP